MTTSNTPYYRPQLPQVWGFSASTTVGQGYLSHGENSMITLSREQTGPTATAPLPSAVAPLASGITYADLGPVHGVNDRQISQPRSQTSVVQGVRAPSSQYGQPIPPKPEKSRRATQAKTKYSRTDWESHQPEIKKLYMEENRGLEYTRRVMNERFGFDASTKHYKEKFAEWQWSKHLPTVTAAWMMMKGDKRRREEGRDTEFIYGFTQYTMDHAEKTLKRSRVKEFTPIADDAPTPAGMIYHTPRNDHPDITEVRDIEEATNCSEAQAHQPKRIDSTPRQDVSRNTPRNAAHDSAQGLVFKVPQLKLRHNGRTRGEFEKLHEEAHQLDQLGQKDLAENAFILAFEGLQGTLWPTHDDTTKLAYCLASFYAKHKRMKEADAVLDRMNDAYVQRWGLSHEKTTSHLLHVLEMLENWSRPDDAMNLIRQAFERMQTARVSELTGSGRAHPLQLGASPTPNHLLEAPEMSTRIRPVDEPVVLDRQLEHAHALALINDRAAEPFLIHLTSQCEKYPEKLGKQTVEVWVELSKLYRGLGDNQKATEALSRAQLAAQKLLDSHEAMNESLLNTLAEVAELYMEHADAEAGSSMVIDIESAAVTMLGTDNEKLILLLTRFGMFYQNRQDWMNARRFFEHALAVSLSLYGPYHVRSEKLQDALDKKRYDLGKQQCGSIVSVIG